MPRKFFIALFAGMLFFGMNISSFAVTCGHDETGALTHAEKKESNEPVNAGNKVCPVMGTKIDEKSKVAYEYKGKIYNFCCLACIKAFKKDPDKYIKKVEEELQKTEAEKPKEEVVDTCCADD
jgi:YHS domain-containing protein